MTEDGRVTEKDRSPDRGSVAKTQLRAAWSVLFWQSALPAFWPSAAVILAFLAVALFDLLPMLLYWAHIAALMATAASLIWTSVKGVLRFDRPTRSHAIRQIEKASGLAHRPLSTLEDRPAADADDPVMASLWAAHRRRVLANLGRLRIGWPAPTIARQDPYGLRIILVLLVFVAWISAGNETGERLRRALLPDGSGAVSGQGITADLWITPPSYTGAAPIYLNGADKTATTGSISFPAGSVLLTQVHGTGRRPKLTIDGSSPGKFTALDDSNYALTTKLTTGDTLQLRAGGSTLARYKLNIVKDAPPQVHFAKPPQPTVHSALGIAYDAEDDYGVASVTLEVRQALASRDATQTSTDPNAPITVPLPAPDPPERNIHGLSFVDLTADPLAGQAVELRLVAVDGIGQTTRSDPVVIMLPERIFNNPLARLIADQRKLLITGSENAFAIARTLLALVKQTTLFGEDTIAFLGVNVAAYQLSVDRTPQSRTTVAALLWDSALRIEDGTLSGAQRSMRQAEEALQDALSRNAPSAELAQLMQKFQQQMARFLQSLAQQEAAHPNQNASSGSARSIDMSDIQKMLDHARDLAQAGDTAGAREAFAQLQEMLESLRAADGQGMSSAAQEALRNMGALQHRQQQLMDRTFQKSRQGANGSANEEAGAQDALRRALNQIMKGPLKAGGGKGGQSNGQSGNGDSQDGQSADGQTADGQTSDGQPGDQLAPALDRANRAMEDAETQLKEGNPGAALEPQGDALDALQQAGQALARQMSQGGKDGQPGGNSRDPLGRSANGQGMVDRGDVTLPTKSDLQRSREILDELRRREGDFTRPREERDYLDRLLKSF